MKKAIYLYFRFRALPLQAKLLFLYMLVCAALPFVMIRSVGETAHAFGLWLNCYSIVAIWHANGKPFLQTFLASYGVTSVGMAGLYLGTFGTTIIFSKLIAWLNKILFSKIINLLKKQKRLKGRIKFPFKSYLIILKLKIVPRYQQLNSFIAEKRKKFIGWLSRQSVWTIFLFTAIPLPFCNIIGTVAMGMKHTKYALWILLLANSIHTFLLVLFIYLGINFFFR